MSKKQLMPSSMPTNRDAFEEWVIECAIEFSVVLFKGRGLKDRWDFPSLRAAIEAASDNPRKMVYATTEAGRSTMISPKQYEWALKIAGRKS